MTRCADRRRARLSGIGRSGSGTALRAICCSATTG
jgi:hypothetical protein